MAASRVQRWGVFLSGYDYEIKFLKGKNNQSADFLSRYMGPSLVDFGSGSKDDFTYLNFVTENVKLFSAASISEETDKYDNLKKRPNKVPESLIPFSRKRNDLYIEKGCVMWGHRVVVLVKTFKDKFILLMSENGKDKQDALVKFLFHYRSSPHCTTGVSPAELQL